MPRRADAQFLPVPPYNRYPPLRGLIYPCWFRYVCLFCKEGDKANLYTRT